MKIHINWWVILILVLGLLVRVIKFGTIPSSLNRDEVALGYNAWALLTEGVDEWGVSWPLAFKSFGDYKLSGYIYLLIPFIKVFGLSDWVIRLPSLLAGVFNIYLIYTLAKVLFPQSKRIGFLAALNLALMPWAVFYSRIAFEAHVGLALTLSYIYLLVTNEKNLHRLWWSALALVLGVVTYNTPLILTPFIVASYVYIWREVWFGGRQLWVSLKYLGLIMLIIVIGGGLLMSVNRAKSGITIFSDATLNAVYRENRLNLKENWGGVGDLLGSRPVFFGGEIFKRGIQSLLPDFLVTRGGQHPWHSLPGWSHLTWVQYGLFVAGVISLVIKRKKTKNEKWLMWVLFFSILPSVITIDSPHATRSLLFLTLTSLMGAYFIDRLGNKNKIGIVLGAALVINSLGYLKDYYLKFESLQSPSWKQGLKEAIISVSEDKSNVYITDYTSSPYIYVLFYKQVKPSEYLNDIEYYPIDNAGLTHVKRLGRYNFISGVNDIDEGIIIDQNSQGKFEVKYLE